MRALVAARARAERQPFELAIRVAARARHRVMGPGERKCRFRMIESAAGHHIPERDSCRVAGCAGRSERPFVHVRVARLARRADGEKRPRFVAGGTLARYWCVLSIQRKSGDARMIEGTLIERSQLAFRTGMLDVARDAVPFYVSMDTGPPRDSLGDRLVTRQTLLRADALSALVARFAVGNALERRVRACEPSWGQQRTELRLGLHMSDKHDRRGECRDLQHAAYHLKGTYPRYTVTATCTRTMISWK